MREDEYRKLAAQRMDAIEELRSFNDAMQTRAGENDGKIQSEDQQEFDRREAEIIELTNRLNVEQRTRYAVQAKADPAEWMPADKQPETFEEFRARNDTRHLLHGAKVSQREVDTPEVRQAVWSWLVKGREGMDIDEYRVLSKAASGGGFFVDSDLAAQIVRAERFLPGGVGSLARTITTSSGETINVPLNLTHGSAAWIAESGTYTPSDETITNATMSAYKAGTKIIISEELLTDSEFDLSSFLSTEFGERIGALAEAAYITGDGSGKPTGITDAASAVSAASLAAGQVTTTTWAAIAGAVYAVPAQYRANMSILVSDSLYVRLATLVDSTGQPLWTPSAASGTPDRFAGIPIYSHPNLAAIGANAKAGIVGDFSKGYTVRRVNGVFMQRQNELHSDSGQVGFRAYTRLDGKVLLADALRIITFAAT